MKKLLGILMILILIAGVFVSCSQDKIEEAVISGEELLDVRFGAAAGRSRALVVDTPEFNDGEYIWYYTAKKADTTGFYTGEKSAKTPVIDPASVTTVDARKGLAGAVISGLSQGYWDFGLYAYLPTSTDKNHDYSTDTGAIIAWQGSVSHFLLVKGAANVVDVTVSPVSAGYGWLIVDTSRITVKDAAGDPVTLGTGVSLAYTVTLVGGTVPVDISVAIPAGAYLVKVVCTGSNIDYAEDSIVVNVYGGLTRTVWGSIGELTTSAVFGDVTAEIIEATTGSKTAEELEYMKEHNQSVEFATQGTIPVSATLPASAAVALLPTDPEEGTDLDLTLTLNVKANAESTEQEVTTKSYDITLVQKLVETTESSSTTTVSNVTDPLLDYLTATLTIDKNLSAVSVTHSTVPMVDLEGATAPTAAQIEADEEAGYPGFYNYDSATGVLTLITKKFSPFAVTYTKPVSGIAEVSRLEGSILKPVANCKSLDDAFELAIDGDIVLVLEDTSLGSTKTVSKEIVIRAVDKIKDVTDPLALAGRGYEGTYDSEHKALTITKTPITDAVARIDDLYFKTLQGAIDAALDGETVYLLCDLTKSTTTYSIAKSISLNGSSFTINGRLNLTGKDIRISNLTMTNPSSSGRCIDTRGNLKSLVLDNVDLLCTGNNGYIQPVTISYSGDEPNEFIVDVAIKDSTIRAIDNDGKYRGYAVILWTPVNLTIEDSDIEAWSAIYSHVSDATINVVDSKLVGVNEYSGYSNDFATIVFDGDSIRDEASHIENNSITVSGETEIIAKQNGNAGQNWISFQYGANDCSADVTIASTTIIHDGTVDKNDKRTDIYWDGNGNSIRLALSDSQVDELYEEGYWVTVIDSGYYLVRKLDVRVQSGTETETYMSLGDFRDDVNSGTPYAEKTVVLLRDVDLKNEEWEPIGTSAHPFNGVFDGQNHIISNLKVTETGKFSGLFGVVCGSGPNTQFDEIGDVLNLDSNTLASDLDDKIVANNYSAVIENLTIDGFTVDCWIEDVNNEENARFSGALVGSAQYAYIGNCDVTNGTVTGCKAFGGVIGSIDGSAVVDCNTSATVYVIAKANLVGEEEGAFNFGGIVGATSYGFSSTYGRSIVKGCTNRATLIKEGGEEKGSIAGIVGFGQNGGYATPSIIVGCAHEGEISCSVKVSDIAGISTVSNHVLYYVNCTNNDDFSGVTVDPSRNAGIATGAPGNNHDRRVIDCASCELTAPTHEDQRWSQILNCGNDTKKIVNCSYGETDGIYYPPIN